MEIEEYYTNSEDDQYDIQVGKCKIFGIVFVMKKLIIGIISLLILLVMIKFMKKV